MKCYGCIHAVRIYHLHLIYVNRLQIKSGQLCACVNLKYGYDVLQKPVFSNFVFTITEFTTKLYFCFIQNPLRS